MKYSLATLFNKLVLTPVHALAICKKWLVDAFFSDLHLHTKCLLLSILLLSFHSVAHADDAVLVIDEINEESHGYQFNGNNDHEKTLNIRFTRANEDLVFELLAYDIDNPSEVSVALNGSRIGALRPTFNNNLGFSAFNLPSDMLRSGSNLITLTQSVRGWRWGVTDMLLSSLPKRNPIALEVDTTDKQNYGFYRNSGSAFRQRLEIEFQRNNTKGLLFELSAFDIDTSDEVSVSLNGNPIDSLQRTPNNGMAAMSVELPLAYLRTGLNRITLTQKNPGWYWGVTDLRLTPTDVGPVPLTVDVVERGKYGYRFAGQSDHRERVEFEFQRNNNQSLQLELYGFDIDTDKEVDIAINDSKIGTLQRTANNGIGPSAFNLPDSLLRSGANQISFTQTRPGWIWGVTDLLLKSDGGGNSPNFCESYVSNADSFVVPSMAKPNPMQSYTDPVFGGKVTRITDSVFGEVNKPAYSTMQAWNADESLLLLYRTGVNGAGHILLDGHSYEFRQNVDIQPADIEQIYWSRTDPDSFFYVSKRSSDFGKFKRFSVSANQSTEVADFSDQCGSGLPSAGLDVQMHAVNDDLFAFKCRRDNGSHIMFSYTPSTNSVVTAPIGSGTSWLSSLAPHPTASGNNFYHQGVVLQPDLRTVQFELDLATYAEHSSLGTTAEGQDAYYQVSFNGSPDGCDGDAYRGVGPLIEHNLETGACRNIISQEQGYPYTTSSTHVSALAYLQTNRVAVSSIGNRSQTPLLSNGRVAPPLFSEIYVAQTDPDDTVVCRFAHHRSFGKSASNGGYAPYFGEPHATISPTGTRVLFGSDWYDSGSVDSYVLELPDYVRP